MTEFFVDCGLTADEARSRIRIGDMVVLDGPFHQVGNTVVSQCLDNRVGCWAQIQAIQQLRHHRCEIHAVWTVQEEVGMRGAIPAAYSVDPDIGVACDTTLCCQTPGVPDEDRISVFGDGVCLHVMDNSMISDIGLVEQFEQVAAARDPLPAGDSASRWTGWRSGSANSAVFAQSVLPARSSTSIRSRKWPISATCTRIRRC